MPKDKKPNKTKRSELENMINHLILVNKNLVEEVKVLGIRVDQMSKVVEKLDVDGFKLPSQNLPTQEEIVTAMKQEIKGNHAKSD